MVFSTFPANSIPNFDKVILCCARSALKFKYTLPGTHWNRIIQSKLSKTKIFRKTSNTFYICRFEYIQHICHFQISNSCTGHFIWYISLTQKCLLGDHQAASIVSLTFLAIFNAIGHNVNLYFFQLYRKFHSLSLMPQILKISQWHAFLKIRVT